MKERLRAHWRAPESVQARARLLRADLTYPERELWRRLRHRQLHGALFRRQHAMGRYIVDFFCADAKLVVEVDGDSHASAEEYDLARMRWLEGRGCRVIRFTNRDVTHDLDAVVARIAEELRQPHCRSM